MPSSIRRIDVAGRDVTEHMQLLFRKSGYVFHTSAEKEVVRMIKEKTGYVALDPKREEKEWLQHGGRPEGKVVEYTLPDGNKMKVRYPVYHTSLRDTILIKPTRSAQSATALPKFSSTPKSSVSNTPESTKSSSTP